jgi:hypothetical protein
VTLRHNRPLNYILDDDNQPVPCNDILEWGEWFQQNPQRRIVAQTKLTSFRVSTVFLGLDHNFYDDGPPLLFETMVFHDDDMAGREAGESACGRWSTWAEAVAGHNEYVRKFDDFLEIVRRSFGKKAKGVTNAETDLQKQFKAILDRIGDDTKDE